MRLTGPPLQSDKTALVAAPRWREIVAPWRWILLITNAPDAQALEASSRNSSSQYGRLNPEWNRGSPHLPD